MLLAGLDGILIVKVGVTYFEDDPDPGVGLAVGVGAGPGTFVPPPPPPPPHAVSAMTMTSARSLGILTRSLGNGPTVAATEWADDGVRR
jgi:hypothetical protein